MLVDHPIGERDRTIDPGLTAEAVKAAQLLQVSLSKPDVFEQTAHECHRIGDVRHETEGIQVDARA